MKKIVLDKWLEALRSGKYKQAKGALRNGNEFCCLGVLTDIYLKEHSRRWSRDCNGDYSFKEKHDTESYVIPADVKKWAGIRNPDPKTKVIRGGRRRSLSLLNDEFGFDFPMIADAIEKRFATKKRVATKTNEKYRSDFLMISDVMDRKEVCNEVV